METQPGHAPDEGLDDGLDGGLDTGAYGAALGLRLEAAEAERARLRLPFREANANPGGALHGGCAASLAAAGARAVARAALGAGAGPLYTAALHVDYLAAAIGEDVEAEARLLRGGKDLAFAAVDVATAGGKAVAHATGVLRARGGDAAAEPAWAPLAEAAAGEEEATDPGPMGPHIERLPFLAARGIRVAHMREGRSRLLLPWSEANASAAGGVDEGALLALLDTTGAMACWAETGPGRFKASTPALQAQILEPPPRADLVARGRVARRDGALFWSDVEVADAGRGACVARGTVIYRIVT